MAAVGPRHRGVKAAKTTPLLTRSHTQTFGAVICHTRSRCTAGRRVSAPTFVLRGSDDRFITLTPRALEARIRGATFHLIEGAGHLSHLESPERFGEAVSTLLRSAGR